MTVSKREARQLAKNAAEISARALRGVLKIDTAGATIDNIDILEWLAQHADREVILVAAEIGEDKFTEPTIKSCHTCGRDYKGEVCTYCAEARARLRGQ